MPVATKIGRIAWDCHHVADAFVDGSVASRTHVALRRLVGLHTAHLDRSVETVPQPGCLASCHQQLDRLSATRSADEGPHDKDSRNGDGRRDEHDVGAPLDASALRVESHGAKYCPNLHRYGCFGASSGCCCRCRRNCLACRTSDGIANRDGPRRAHDVVDAREQPVCSRS